MDSNVAAQISTQMQAEVDLLAAELVDLRRDIHAHPELSWAEERTSTVLTKRLAEAGLAPQSLPRGGVRVDIGPAQTPTGEETKVVALRADIDALPIDETSSVPWASTVPGVAHACGHDVHTAALLGAGLALTSVADRLPGRVRLIFQPAEEVMPGGALMAIEGGVLEGVSAIFAVHCDPALNVGQVGLREGPLTGAADALDVRLSGGGGHTSRPHLTEDLTFALAKLVTELPAVLSRRLDPRAGVSVVWGLVRAGSAMNVVPARGRASGTVRMLDQVAWAAAEDLVRATIDQIILPYGVACEVSYVRGVPPVVNEAHATGVFGEAISAACGPQGQVSVMQSLGGEDFAWYLDQVPGAMARLGTRTPGGLVYDLHQGDLQVDEGAIMCGAKLLAEVGVRALVTSR